MTVTRLLLIPLQIFFLFFFLADPTVSIAQDCTPVYKKTYGGNGDDDGLDVLKTTDNGTVVAGRSTSDANNTNAFLMKLNEQGTLQWVKSYGGEGFDELVKAKQTSDGGFIAIGNTATSALTNKEVFLIRTDGAGNLLWTRKFSKSGSPATAKQVIQLSDGGFALALNLHDSSEKGDGVILRTDATGSVLWSKTFDFSGNNGFHTLIEDEGYLVASGYLTNDFLDGVLMKIRITDGGQEWMKRFVRKAGLHDEVVNVEKIPGGYTFGVYSRFVKTISSNNNAELYMFKIKEDGTIYSQRRNTVSSGRGYTVESVDFKVTADSGFLFYTNDTITSKNATYMKVTSSGLLEWGKQTSEYHEVSSINAIDLFDNRGYLLTGTYKEYPFLSGPTTKEVQVLKTDIRGTYGTCTGREQGSHSDTVKFGFIGPFNWSAVHDGEMFSESITVPSANLNFIEKSLCEKVDCEPVSTQPSEECYATFITHYKDKYRFVPFDVMKVNDGYILSGYTSYYWSVEPRIVKLRLNGTVAWSKSLNNYIHDASFQKLFLTEDGNILLTGPDGYTINHSGYTGTTFIKITQSGEVLWARNIEGTLSDLHPSGGGTFTGLMLVNIATPPVYAAKFRIDAAGNFSYIKRLNSNSEFIASYTKMQVDGNFMYTAGLFNGFIWLDKLDSAGHRVWSKQFKPDDKPAGIQSLNIVGDSVYLALEAYTKVGWTTKGNIMMVKVGKDGGGINGFLLNEPSIVPDFSTYYFWVGTFASRVVLTEDNNFVAVNRISDAGDSVVAITKFTPTGQVLWSKKYPGLDHHKIMSVRDEEGSLLISGFSMEDAEAIGYGLPSRAIVIRTDSKGEFVTSNDTKCSGVALTPTTSPISINVGHPYLAPKPTFAETDYRNIPFTPVVRNFTVGSELGCGTPSNCSSLNITGPESVCNFGETIVYSTVRNQGCILPASWVYDTTLMRLIALTDTTLSVQFKKAGKGKIYAKYATGCGTLTDTLHVTAISPANTMSLGPDRELCPGNHLELKAGKDFATYQWQDGSVDSFFTVKEPGKYFVSVTDLCGRQFSDTIIIGAQSPIPFDVSQDRVKCNSDTLRFTAPEGFTNYSWSPNYKISSSTDRSIVVNPLMDTVYYVKAEKTPGCFAYDTIRVAVHISPAIQLGSDLSFCKGDSVAMDAGAGFSSYLWSTNETSQKITLKSVGIYSIKATTDQGCSSYDTVSIKNVWNLPQVKLDKNRELCTGEFRALSAGNFASYQWQDGSTTPTINVSGLGRYYVEVRDANGCAGSDTTLITSILPLPQNFLPADTVLCTYSSLTLRARQSFQSYSWSTGSKASSITIGQPALYWLQVKDAKGCTGRDSIVIKPKECMQGVYIPTAFTPNKDGKNDIFQAKVFGPIKQFELIVYNRWGQVIFHTKDAGKGWDGKLSGLEQDTGVFMWTCRYSMQDGNEKTEKGTVTIIR